MKANMHKQASKPQIPHKGAHDELVFYPQAMEENRLHASIGVSDKKKPSFVQSSSDAATLNPRNSMPRRHPRQVA